jgi:peptide-methionine (R)-S-oxide reductase
MGLLGIVAVGVLAMGIVATSSAQVIQRPADEPGGKAGTIPGSPKRKDKVVLSDAEWRKKLTKEQYAILRNHDTEAAFCGRFHDTKKKGTYLCAGCDLPLFASNAKFDSGTGWPSFFQPYSKKNVWGRRDMSLGMARTEVLCARCDGHLGHVFDDGPIQKGGLRYCINSDGLKFIETK